MVPLHLSFLSPQQWMVYFQEGSRVFPKFPPGCLFVLRCSLEETMPDPAAKTAWVEVSSFLLYTCLHYHWLFMES